MSNKAFKALGTICFIVYLMLLIRVSIFYFPDTMISGILSSWSVEGFIRHLSYVNFIPFKTIGPTLFNPSLPWIEVPNMLANIIGFVPLGFMIPYLIPSTRKIARILIIGFGVSLALEAVQVVTILGTGDIDDVLLNVVGALLGYALFEMVSTAWLKVSRPFDASYETVG